MDRTEIFDTIQSIAAQTFSIAEENITMEFSNNTVESWDSLGHLRLFMAIEEHFSIKFDVDEITSAQSIADVVRLIKKKQA